MLDAINKEKNMSFEFTQDGRTYRVRSVTGEGLTKFEWQEIDPPAQPALEPSEDA